MMYLSGRHEQLFLLGKEKFNIEIRKRAFWSANLWKKKWKQIWVQVHIVCDFRNPLSNKFTNYTFLLCYSSNHLFMTFSTNVIHHYKKTTANTKKNRSRFSLSKPLSDLESESKQYTHLVPQHITKFFSSIFFFCSIKVELELNFYLSHLICAHVNRRK